jgi:hypothetical protein
MDGSSDITGVTVRTIRDFDATLAVGREAYLASPTGKARKAIAKADRLTRGLTEALAGLSCVLSRGDGSERARTALFDAMLDLRIACGDVEALVRLVEAEAAR